VQFACQAQVEIGKVDKHGGVWPPPFGLAHHFAEAAIDERNVLDYLDNADLGDLARIHQKIATGGAHLVSANAEELQVGRRSLMGELAAQSFHELGAIKLAGGLSRGDEDTHSGIMTGRSCQTAVFGQAAVSRVVYPGCGGLNLAIGDNREDEA